MSAPTSTEDRSLESPPRRRRRDWSFDNVSFFAVFLGLPLAIFLIFVMSPVLQAFYYSLTNWTGFSPDFNFVGFSNYVTLANDPTFQLAFQHSLLLGIFVPFITIVLALVLASFITVAGVSVGQTRGLKASALYRVVSFFPYTIPAVVVSLLWNTVFTPQGLMTKILHTLGVFPTDSFSWMADDRTAMPIIMFMMIWSFVGFYMVLFIAAIKGIPAEIFEAVRLDGAGRFRTMWSITIPLIRDNVQTAYIYLGIAALDAFVYVAMVSGYTSSKTVVMSQALYQQAFEGVGGSTQAGLACAMGVVLALTTMSFAGIVFAVNRYTGGKDKVEMA